MPVLTFLRAYGTREYAVTLAIAAIAGLVIAVLINSASGGAPDPPAMLKAAPASAPAAAPKALEPVRTAPPVTRHRHRHHVHRARPATPAPVTITTPAPKPVVSTPVSTPAPAPAPVVRAPASKPAPKKGGGGGGVQFDDSG